MAPETEPDDIVGDSYMQEVVSIKKKGNIPPYASHFMWQICDSGAKNNHFGNFVFPSPI